MVNFIIITIDIVIFNTVIFRIGLMFVKEKCFYNIFLIFFEL